MQLLERAVKINVATSQPEGVISDETAPEGMAYVVQAGIYKHLNGARTLQKEIEKKGVISLIKLYSV